MRRHVRLTATILLVAIAGPVLAGERAPDDAKIKPEDRAHWAFQPIRNPPVPAVENAAWCLNPIDRFVLSKLETKGWRPAPPATPEALLRRVSLDLTGLPPTPEERAAFLARREDGAFERLIDELLARPAYGERWGRHWLDLVRFAESNGYERDAAKPFAWRYRDYVIRALNADKPYDRFLIEQLAGDELPDANAETMIATGYYRLGPWDDEPADPKQDRFDHLDDLVVTTSEVFLGLTLGCARCHDHKFEPLTALDYYRMVAVFNGLERPRQGRTELDLPIGTPAQLRAQAERDRQIQTRTRMRTARTVASSFPLLDSLARAVLQVEAVADDLEIARLRAETPDLPRGYFLREPSASPPPTNLLLRGQATAPGPVVAPGMPAVLVGDQPEFLPPGERTSRRRLSLARWLASPEHPLTARVIVNRVWQHHFGEGLVRSPSDFGTMGDPPTHPELLDWLASWFVSEGWSLKKLHRLILSSNTYRMGRRDQPSYRAEDPENRLLWRMPARRLDVEAIRDSVLAASGQLNRALYGPSIFPSVPAGALEGNSDPDKIWKASAAPDAARRTIYVFVKRSLLVPMIEALDFCDTARSTARRNVTSVAPQALTLYNGEFVNTQARLFAERIAHEAGDDPERRIERAFLLALARAPTASERATLRKFLEEETRGFVSEAIAAKTRVDPSVSAPGHALEQMCRAVLNLNEFVYPD